MIARFTGFTLDSDRRQLLRGSAEVHLTPKAFDLLTLLIAEAPRVVPKSELHGHLWPTTFVSDTTLVGLVKELRRALDDHDSNAPIVRTATRVGYAFAGLLKGVDSRTAPAGVRRWVVVGGRTVVLVAGENLIGRHPASNVNVDAAGVSRRHARIVVGNHEARLEDLGSKNGTLVHNVRVTGPVLLCDGDDIRLGPIAILYRESDEGPSTETAICQD